MLDPSEIRARCAAVRERMAAAAGRAGRDPEAITLVAVTKTWPGELVVAAYEAGLRHFGENRPEELAAKRPLVEAALGGQGGITWHLIGPVQSRKSHLAAAQADIFHALDRMKIARRLSADLKETGRVLPAFIEVNVSGEAGKFGLDLSNWESDATQGESLRRMMIEAGALPGLHVFGLMTMAPWDAEPAVVRAVFRRTRQLAAWLHSLLPDAGPMQLSMGMTDDFEIAIEEGATHIRVGRALFGEREG
jgi:pyridoxal phosphate enzyme (YggS family)